MVHSSKPVGGQNIALHASSAVRNSAFVISADPVHSTSFFLVTVSFRLELSEAPQNLEMNNWFISVMALTRFFAYDMMNCVVAVHVRC